MDRRAATVRHCADAGASGHIIAHNEVPAAVDQLGLPLLLGLVDVGRRLLLHHVLLRLLFVGRLCSHRLLLHVPSLIGLSSLRLGLHHRQGIVGLEHHHASLVVVAWADRHVVLWL